MSRQMVADSISITQVPLRKLFRPYRILIMKMLEQSGENGVPFQELKEDLELTDGNLATQLRSLEQEGFITFFKTNEGHKTKTFYKLTDNGENTLQTFTEKLRNILYT